jgi:sulfate permease, SulP family
MGAANAAAGFTQGFSVGASGSRTAVNDDMGARSQIAGLVAAVTVAVIVLLLTGPVQCLPKAVLGAVIVTAAIGLIDPQAWRALAAVDPVEVAIAAVTTGYVIAFGVLQAPRRRARLGRAAGPLRRRLTPPPGAPDAGRGRLPSRRPSVLRQRPLLQGPRARGNPRGTHPRVLARIRRRGGHPCRLDRARGATAQATDLRHEGITLVVARLRTRMQEQFQQAGITETIGTENFYPSVHAAVDRFTHTGTGTTGPACPLKTSSPRRRARRRPGEPGPIIANRTRAGDRRASREHGARSAS